MASKKSPRGRAGAGEAGSGGSGRKPPVKPPRPKGRGETYADIRRAGQAKRQGTKPGNTLREKVARIEADKSLSRPEKDRMIKSVRQRHSKSAAEG